MERATLHNADGSVLVARVDVADCVSERMVGLLSRDALAEDEALFLAPCASVHTIGMRFAIDLLFVDHGMRVVRCVHRVEPLRMSWGGRDAWGVFELPAGRLDALPVREGDTLTLAAASPC